MKIKSASIPTRELMETINDKCASTAYNRQFSTYGDDGSDEPIYTRNYWLQDQFLNTDVNDCRFSWHMTASDSRLKNKGKREFIGVHIDDKAAIRPILITDTCFDNDARKKRYRIAGYEFEPIPSTNYLFCTSFIELMKYRKSPYKYESPDAEEWNENVLKPIILKPDVHDYNKSDVKKFVDKWFKREIQNAKIVELALVTEPISITFDLALWAENSDDAAKLAYYLAHKVIIGEIMPKSIQTNHTEYCIENTIVSCKANQHNHDFDDRVWIAGIDSEVSKEIQKILTERH